MQTSWLRTQRMPFVVVLSLLLTGLATTPRAADPGAAPRAWQASSSATGGYHTYQQLTAALTSVVGAHANIARVESIGKTREGRDIWAVTVANQAGTPVASRPAVLIAANFEGDHVVGSEIALSVVEHLLADYASDPAVRERIDTQAFYIVPRVNPDGAELMFAAVKTGRRTNATPFDADNDGRIDEDGPQDLNGDGQITVMRVKDPAGPYMIDPADPRLMKKADPAKGEHGGYAIYLEGLDKDGDGFIAEDGAGGVDINRNFMHQYPYHEPDAGRYMASEAETRALLDFVVAHRNIAAILAFGESDNLIGGPSRRGDPRSSGLALQDFAEESVAGARHAGMFQDAGAGGRGFGMGRGGGGGGGRGGAATQASGGRGRPSRAPETSINTADLPYFTTVSERYREVTGLRTLPAVRTPAGAFFEYGYFQYGVPSFSTPGWSLDARPATSAPETPDEAAVTGRGPFVPQGRGGQTRGQAPGMAGRGAAPAADAGPADQRVLRWMDAEKVDGFVKWTAFKHPTLGEVEIGGFRPYAASNPPAERLPELGASHAKFVLYLSSLLPHVKIAKTEVTSHGAGLYRIQADVVNNGYLPTALAHGVVAGAVKPTMVQLGIGAADIIAGNEKTSFVQALAGSGGLQHYEWIVKGKPGSTVTLKVVSQKSGTDSASITLR